MSYTHHRENVPLSILDGSDGDLIVEFDWKAGKPEFIPPYDQPEVYDPGCGDEFIVGKCCYANDDGEPLPIPVGLGTHEEQRVIEWLDEHWIRPCDDGPDPDYARDMRRDEAA